MCGLVAIAAPGTSALRAERFATSDETRRGFQAAMARLHRRGPDARGIWHAPTHNVTLGHTRLAIIDLTDAGLQPMTNSDESLAVAFNGEIYNAPALTRELTRAGYHFRSRSDTEVLIHGYRDWGAAGLLSRLIGMFAFVIWDERKGELFAAVDPAGMKPLCWSCTGGTLYIASEADALRSILPEPPELDATALCHVLCHGYCPPPLTVWRNIAKLGPGQAMHFSPGDTWGGSPRTWRYWTAPEELSSAPASAANAHIFAELWEEVVSDHLLSDVPVGIFLSGGLDSSAVALALSRIARDRQPECITLGLDSTDDESSAAAGTAAMLGLPHTRIAFGAGDVDPLLAAAADAFDEPQTYGALLTATRVAQAARDRGKVMIAGDGGDEAFGGYTWHARPPRALKLPNRPGRSAVPLASAPSSCEAWLTASGPMRAEALEDLAGRSVVHGHLQAVFPRFHPAEAAAILAPLSPHYDEHIYAAWAGEHDRDALPWPRRGQRLDLMGFCAGSILPKIDRSSMAVGLELRAPFLDRRILEWALRLPVTEGPPKAILREYLAGHVPAGVLERPKQGFSLRLGRDVWSERLPWLRRTRLVTEGLLHPRWEAFVAPDVPFRSQRILSLCMLAAWAEGDGGGRF